jgi:hypothetical protein
MCSFFDPISFRGRYQTCPNFDSTVREYIERLNLFTPQQVTAMKSEWAAYYREVHLILDDLVKIRIYNTFYPTY